MGRLTRMGCASIPCRTASSPTCFAWSPKSAAGDLVEQSAVRRVRRDGCLAPSCASYGSTPGSNMSARSVLPLTASRIGRPKILSTVRRTEAWVYSTVLS